MSNKKRRPNPWLRPKVIIRLSLLTALIVLIIANIFLIFTPKDTAKATAGIGMTISNFVERLTPSKFSKEERDYIATFGLPEELQNKLMNDPLFSIDKMPTYAEILEDNESVTYAIQFGLYPNVKTNFYGDIVTLTNPESTLALVNKNYALPEDYVPTDLVYLENTPLYAPGRNNEANYLREIAAQALTEMFETAKQEQGYTLIARSGYRSYETQVGLYRHYVQTNGQWYADAYSARAGHSEHQTGLTIDVTSRSVSSGLSATFGTSPEGQWVAQNCHKFGFIIRYPDGRTDEVGYEYEPWHLRYVGIDAATEIFENNSILEDYLLEHALIENQ